MAASVDLVTYTKSLMCAQPLFPALEVSVHAPICSVRLKAPRDVQTSSGIAVAMVDNLLPEQVKEQPECRRRGRNH